MIQILETRKMAEGATDSSPEETGNHDLTISSNVDASEMDYLEGNKGTLFKFGFGLPELYKLSLEYYRKGKKVLDLTYEDKLQLVAYWKQVSSGRYDINKMPETGYFDVVGNDRRKAWQELGDMSAEEAMECFCNLLEEVSPQYTAFMEAQRLDKEEKERLRREEEERRKREEEERKRREEEERRQREEEEERERQRLAEEAEAQRELMEERQRLEITDIKTREQERIQETPSKPVLINPAVNGTAGRSIAPASLWTRPKLQEFIQHVKRDASSVIVVGRGETVTIRVPTHEHGSCLFWEFATDSYDLGFGVYFEWSVPPSKDVSVNVDESDEELNDAEIKSSEIEPYSKLKNKPLVDEILPVIRRNSHEEVIVGSHMYPGQGVYLLKFDNSYSLLRSKTLFYRVYYTR